MTQSHIAGRLDLDQQDAYFSVDIESDGPIPGTYSMLSLGIVQAGIHNGDRFVPPETPQDLYLEFRPLSTASVDAEALGVNNLDRERLKREGYEPGKGLTRLAEWITHHSGGRRPVMVGSPASFDWMFVHWYFVSFVGHSPFGHSSCFDLKTMVSVKMNKPIARSSVKRLPDWMDGDVARTHHALDDAKNQAQVFSNVMEWRGATEWSSP